MRYGLKLLDVERPWRYEGREAGSVTKDWDAARLRVALCFPDVYEIGMSHLGLPILYELLNDLPDVLAERSYAPWGDMEALMRREGFPLVARESGRPLRDFDLVGVTLQYELSITNALTMLDLGGIPLLAADRGEDAPLVLGGGPVALNPEPYAEFFDAVFLGEAEEGIVEIARALADAKSRGASRRERLDALAGVSGIYVPSRLTPRYEQGRFAGFAGGTPVKRRILADLGEALPKRPLLPFGEAVHDRLSVEIARGCTRGCRFCQAGFVCRPVREREPAALLSSVADGLACTGHEEVGLLSLSTGDYSQVGPLLLRLMAAHSQDRVSVSLPSLRIDNLDDRLIEEAARVRKSGFTMAPEAGSERLRRAVNKDFSDDAIVGAVERVFAGGWKSVKLYFMLGLPFETEEDLDALERLARRIAGAAPGGRGRITVSISNFVPKPHTPFQWSRQLDVAGIEAIQARFKRTIPGKKVALKLHDAEMSRLEGILARGDRRLGRAILLAWRKGCRMDGWSGEFKPALWREALAEAGLSGEEFLREIPLDAPLPWDLVDSGVDPSYLRREFERARDCVATGDCRGGECQGCGLCDFATVRPVLAARKLDYPETATEPLEHVGTDPSLLPRLRFTYEKTGAARLLSHLETASSFHRAFRAAGVPLSFSGGFNPHPRLQLGPAMPLGSESLCEAGEMRVNAVPDLGRAVRDTNALLPEGIVLKALWLLGTDSRSLQAGNAEEEYEVWPTAEAHAAAERLGGWDALLADFSAQASYPVVKRRRNKPDRELEAKNFVRGLWREGATLRYACYRDPDGGTVAAEMLLAALLGLPEGARAVDRIVKLRMEFQ